MAKLNCVTVLAPAKLNLALDVVGLLPNGYHNLDMTMQAITLYERVVLRRSQNLSLTLPGSPVAANDSNTAIKAALAFFHYTGLLAGVEITIYKNVPVRAGMAGGSADAAGVLVGLNVLYGAKLSMSELCALGAKIGADVPFALMGGTCRVQGVGDVMKALPPCPDCWFTVVMPDYGVSTPEAFAAYDKVGSSTHPDCEAQEKAIRAEAPIPTPFATCSCVKPFAFRTSSMVRFIFSPPNVCCLNFTVCELHGLIITLQTVNVKRKILFL